MANKITEKKYKEILSSKALLEKLSLEQIQELFDTFGQNRVSKDIRDACLVKGTQDTE